MEWHTLLGTGRSAEAGAGAAAGVGGGAPDDEADGGGALLMLLQTSFKSVAGNKRYTCCTLTGTGDAKSVGMWILICNL